MPDDLLDNYAAALLWNRPGPEAYWFHYTSPRVARTIVREGTFSDPDTRDGMLLRADSGSLVRLPDQIIGFAQRAGSRWRHSRGCFEPAHLRMLTGDDQP